MSGRPPDPGLIVILEENLRLLELLRPVTPSTSLIPRLRAIADTPPARAAVQDTLALLAPGSLADPPFSEELGSRLRRIPAHHPRRIEVAAPAPRKGRFSASHLDWRVSVALAYAAAFLILAVLKIDPLSEARKTAFDLASSGQQAVEEARSAAEKRLRESAIAGEATSLTRRLDYRIYRTVEVSKARAAAWGSVVFDKLFGQTEEQPARAGQRERPSPRTDIPEPDRPDFRS